MPKDTGYGGKSANAKLGGDRRQVTRESIRGDGRFVPATLGNVRPGGKPTAMWTNRKGIR